jgi:hypothetical protein
LDSTRAIATPSAAVALVVRCLVVDSKAVDKIAVLIELVGVDPPGGGMVSVEWAVTVHAHIHHATITVEVARTQHVAFTCNAMDK